MGPGRLTMHMHMLISRQAHAYDRSGRVYCASCLQVDSNGGSSDSSRQPVLVKTCVTRNRKLTHAQPDRARVDDLSVQRQQPNKSILVTVFLLASCVC